MLNYGFGKMQIEFQWYLARFVVAFDGQKSEDSVSLAQHLMNGAVV